MKNAFARFGRTCASVVIGSGLMAGALLAGDVNEVSVNLPHAVTVGSVTLPSGHYTISTLEMTGGEEYFIVRGEHTPVVTLQAQKVQDSNDADRTKVTLSQDGDQCRFDTLVLSGAGTSYQFINTK